MEITDLLLLFVFGAAGGFLSGLLGIGGGLIYIPVIDFFLAKYQLPKNQMVPYTISNSITTIFFAGVAGSLKQLSDKTYYLRPVVLVALPAMVLGVGVSWSIAEYQWYNRALFNMVYLAILVYSGIRLNKKQHIDLAERGETPSAWPYLLIGGFTGMVSALSGLGGGIVMVPLMVAFAGQSVKKAASISIGAIPLLACAMAVYYGLTNPPVSVHLPRSSGYLLFDILLPLVVGAVVFAPLGVASAKRMKEQTVKWLFLALIVVIFVVRIFQIANV